MSNSSEKSEPNCLTCQLRMRHEKFILGAITAVSTAFSTAVVAWLAVV